MATIRVIVLALVVGVTVAQECVQEACPWGWMRFRDSCYMHSGFNPLPFKEAQEACKKLGARLAVPHDSEENDFLWENSVNRGHYIWIGCDDKDTEGEFVCNDGSNSCYRNWFSNSQPDNGKFQTQTDNEDCVSLLSNDRRWFDLDCSQGVRYICKRPVYQRLD